MNARERIRLALQHRQPDRVPVDFGGTFQTGMGAGLLTQLGTAVTGDRKYRVKVHEPYQMLGEVDDLVRQSLRIDTVPVYGRDTMFGFSVNGKCKPFTLFDGTEVQVPSGFNVTPSPGGGYFMHPGGDVLQPPRAVIPKGGHFFSTITRQEPIDETSLNPDHNCEEFSRISDDEVNYLASRAKFLHDTTEFAVVLTLPGTAFGDIAQVPAPWLPSPKGIRSEEEWYMSLIARPAYVYQVFEKQLEFALTNTGKIIEACRDFVDVAVVCGTDFGTQSGPMISIHQFNSLFKPFYQEVNGLIHRETGWKTFKHSCGAVRRFIPSFIDAGFDILNPVQVSAAGMNAAELKSEFRGDMVFWGGGVDTQHTLPFGTPEEVHKQVLERIELLNEGGGFVFSSIHNVLSNTPLENLLALVRALHDARGIDYDIIKLGGQVRDEE